MPRPLALILVLFFTACGPAPAAVKHPGGPAAAETPSATATPSPSASATAAAAVQPAPPPAAPPRVATGTFALIPFGGRGASGSVTVTVQAGAFSVSVFASGLAPMSTHAVHLHAGNCGFAYGGRHLLVVGSLVASGSGSGSLTSFVGFPYSTGRFVIVYAGLTQGTILGCADLGPI